MNVPSWKTAKLVDSFLADVAGQLNPDELYEPSEICQYVKDNYAPEDVFSQAVLEDWAFEAGFRNLDE